jgi:hypothetical protein
MTSHLVAALVALAPLLGCAFDDTGDLPAKGLFERLGTRESLALVEPNMVGVAAYHRSGAALSCIQPDVGDGELVLRSTASGLLLVEKLTIELSDVIIGPDEVAPDPVHLTDLYLALGTQLVLEPRWSDDGLRAEGNARGDLVLDWAAIARDGQPVPLAPQKLDELEFGLSVRLSPDGTIEADLGTAAKGPLWSFDAVAIADLALAVHATTAANSRVVVELAP